MNFFIKFFIFLFVSFVINLEAKEAENTTRADTHAPIDIKCDHYHKKNEIMLSYRFMNMKMDGYLKVSSNANYSEARTNLMEQTIWLYPLK